MIYFKIHKVPMEAMRELEVYIDVEDGDGWNTDRVLALRKEFDQKIYIWKWVGFHPVVKTNGQNVSKILVSDNVRKEVL